MTVREATRIALQECQVKESDIQKALDRASVVVPGGKGSSEIPDGYERGFIDRVKKTYLSIRQMPKPLFEIYRDRFTDKIRKKVGEN